MNSSSIRVTAIAVCVAISSAISALTTLAQQVQPQELAALFQTLAPVAPQGPAAATAQTTVAETPRVSMTTNGFLRSIGAPPGQHFVPATGLVAGQPEITARGFLLQRGRLFGIQSPTVDFATRRNRPGNGRNYLRLQQLYQNIPVVAAEVVVQVDLQGGIESVLSDIETDTTQLDAGTIALIPTLTAEQAAQAARNYFASRAGNLAIQTTAPVLSLFAPSVLDEAGSPVLVWDLNVSCAALIEANARVLVDARNGQVVRVWTMVHSALNRQIFDANTTTNDPGTLVRLEGGAASGVADADNAYTFLGDTYLFYFANHGRDSLNGSGMILSATVRYCQPNGTNPPFCPPQGLAFYSGNRMYFGTGYVADDVTAHELTHGVTGFESGLIYANASGAINESFSDVWGEFVDLSNTSGTDTPAVRWDIGEDIPGGRIRSMTNPPALGDPDRLNSLLYVSPTNSPNITNDFGGVHSNSGVNNKLCYLLTDGNTFNGQTVYGMGVGTVASLYYEVQVNLLTSAAGWTELYNALTQAAVNLGWNTSARNNLYRACLAVEIASAVRDLYVDKTSGCPIPAGLPICVLSAGPYVTVGQGVNGANPGDVLHVRTGSYNEPMTVTKILTIQAENGPVTIGQ